VKSREDGGLFVVLTKRPRSSHAILRQFAEVEFRGFQTVASIPPVAYRNPSGVRTAQ
jgi:hypothetical protein